MVNSISSLTTAWVRKSQKYTYSILITLKFAPFWSPVQLSQSRHHEKVYWGFEEQRGDFGIDQLVFCSDEQSDRIQP